MAIKFEIDEEIRAKIKDIVETLQMEHIDMSRLACMRSRGSGSQRTIARCYALSKIWQKALGINAHYIVEVISEKYDRLSEEEKEKVLVHELMHVPWNFGGGFKHHGNYVTTRNVEKMHAVYREKRLNKKLGFKLF